MALQVKDLVVLELETLRQRVDWEPTKGFFLVSREHVELLVMAIALVVAAME